jgi:uncharacterized surface anchored protein
MNAEYGPNQNDQEVSMNIKRTIAAAIAAIMLIGVMPLSVLAADWGEGDTLEDALSELKVGFDDALLDWLTLPSLGVIKLRYTYFMFKNGRTGAIDEHPVYCIDPTKGGAHDIVAAVGPNSDGSSTATYIRGEKVGDPKYRGILSAGYPHQMLSSLGLQTREEGYYATKLALWMYIRGNDPAKLAINPAYDGDPAANRVRAAAISIFNNGIGGSIYEPALALTGKPSAVATLDTDGKYYVQEIEVYANGWIGENPAASGDVRLAWASAPPAGTEVLGTHGENIASSMNVAMDTVSGKSGWFGKITIKYPAEGIDPETFSPPTLNASALLPNSEIYVAYAKANKDKYQRYLVERDPKIELTASFVSQLEATEEGDPQELRIRKVQAGTNIPLAGAVFEIRDPDGRIIYSLTTDESGIIDVPLSVMGNYTVTETVPPRYHLLPETRTQSVTVRYGETAEVTFADAPYGLLRVVKRDAANGQPLGGAAVRIKNIVTNAASEGFTDSSGSAVFDKLPVGAYEIVEITAPDGYALDGAVHTVNVTPLSDGETSYVLTNKAEAGLRIVKFDRQALTPIEGVTFEIWRDGELYGTYKTDAWGEIELRSLPAGTYTAREAATVAPYVLDPTAQWIEIHDGQGFISELYFFNLQKPGMRLVKVDSETLGPLPNARFKISRVGGAYANEFTTDVNGEIDLAAIEPGAYTVQELAAPDGYIIDDAVRTIQLNAGESAQFVFTDTRKPSFELVKLDSKTGKPLAGAAFRIAKIEDGSRYLDRVTDTQGKIRIDDLAPGVYSAQELAAPEGYVPDETEYHVELFPGRTSTLVVNNAHKPDLRIVKTDRNTGAPIAGTVFTVRKADSATVTTVTTDKSGESVIIGLDPGVYEVTEQSVPEGYILDTQPQMITLFPNREGAVRFQNYPKPWLEVWKYDKDTAEPLPDAEFSVRKKGSGVVVYEGMTNRDGYIRLENLDAGWYTVAEMAPPPGYLLGEPNTRDVYLEPGKGSVVKFDNEKRPVLIIRKYDMDTAKPLADAEFSVSKQNGSVVWEGLTGRAGFAQIPNLDAGWYVVTELAPPPGYLPSDTPSKTVYLDGGKTLEVKFDNKSAPSLIVRKYDEITVKPLPDTEFSIARRDGPVIYEGLTGSAGFMQLQGLEDGRYVITEMAPPPGYLQSGTPSREVYLEGGKTLEVKFDNVRKPVLVFLKTNALTGNPIPGATFKIECEQPDGGVQNLGSFKTGADGRIVIPRVNPGWYILTETLPAQGFSLPNNPVTRMYVGAGQNAYLDEFEQYYTGAASDSAPVATTEAVTAPVTFAAVAEHSGSAFYMQGEGFNWPLNSIVIKKTHAVTGELLAGAAFELYRADEQVSGVPGTMVGRYTTDNSGVIVITGLEPGYYIVKEVQAPANFLISENSQQNGYLKADGTAVLEFTFANYPYGSLLITKTDAQTGLPLADARFKVTDASGAVVGSAGGEYVTDSRGEILIPSLKPGAYVVTELKAPEGYAPTAAPKTIAVGNDGKTYTAAFENEPLGSLVIRKLDADTREPLPGAEFMVTKADGSVVGASNGVFVTDSEGTVEIPNLPKGSYVVKEAKAPDGYVLESNAQTVSIGYGKTHTLTVENSKKSGVQIIKLDSATRQPIAGAVFSVSKMDGEKVGEYTTDKAGTIFIPGLESGWYIVVETKAADGYLIDAEPRNVEITKGEPVTLTIENTPVSGLLIVKTDAATGKPLAGVLFDVTRSDGQRVAGNISDGNQPGTEANSPNKTVSANGGISGSYTTDASGRILIGALPAGEYHVTERKAAEGYELDETVRSVTVTPGKLATLQIANSRQAGLRLLKIDSVTKEPIYGVEFMLFDSDNKVVGNYTTDSGGVIDFDGILSEGRYTIRETKPAAGYYRDDMPRTVEFVSGKVTEIRWENTPQMGQIQILKLSGDDNEQNGLPEGSPLSGAVFEIYEHKSGNLADRFVSGADGRAVSKPLPLGRYTVKEVEAPAWYQLSAEYMDIEIEFATQIVKREFLNHSANTGVKIRKTGNYETMPGDTIRYDIKEVANTSSVPLTDFFWRDVLPTDAVRLQKIVTGTYSQSLNYKILVTTNKGDTKVVADNLRTTQNNVVDCRNAALGLASDEYVTSFTLIFGAVKAGFCQVTVPQIYVTVNKNLPNGYEFGNKCDAGGKYSGEFVIGGSTWVTTVYAPPVKLPRTGY